MRLFTVFLTFLLALTACAAPEVGSPATLSPSEVTQDPPMSVPAKPTAASANTALPESHAPTLNATFEASLPAIEWKGGSGGNLLLLIDPASGATLPGYTPISLGQGFSQAFSPDRHTLAIVSFPNDQAYNGSLLLVDLPAWKTRRFELKLNGWVGAMVFSPNGERLAISHGGSTSKLTIFNLEQGAIVAQGQTDLLVTHMKFTPSGEALMLYGLVIKNRFTENEMNGGPPQVLLLDAANLSQRWSVELKDVRDGIFPKDEKAAPDLSQPGTAMYLSPAIAFAPDRAILYIVHADSEQLTRVDFGAQRIETEEIQTKLTWFENLLSFSTSVAHAKVADGTGKQAAISPDGRFLYVVGVNNTSLQDQQGNWQMSQTPLGLEIIQTSDGSRVERVETDATDLSLSPDGRFLYLRNWGDNAPWTEILETSKRKLIIRKEGLYAAPALRMNGEFLLVSTYSSSESSHQMSILQPDGLSMLAHWTGHDYISWLTTP